MAVAGIPWDQILEALTAACRKHYGQRLAALAVFGSVGRGQATEASDIDLLVVVRSGCRSRPAALEEFGAIEKAMMRWWQESLGRPDPLPELSPVFCTPANLERRFPLMLDMVHDARLLYDPDGILKQALDALSRRLEALGARRIPYGGAWY
ncbi:MAG TPA: nucleotidyltransferase domain-containing protein, partial [Bacillota bacterium]